MIFILIFYALLPTKFSSNILVDICIFMERSETPVIVMLMNEYLYYFGDNMSTVANLRKSSH